MNPISSSGAQFFEVNSSSTSNSANPAKTSLTLPCLIETTTGLMLSQELDMQWTGREVKHIIAKREGIDFDQFAVSCVNQRIGDDETLTEFYDRLHINIKRLPFKPLQLTMSFNSLKATAPNNSVSIRSDAVPRDRSQEIALENARIQKEAAGIDLKSIEWRSEDDFIHVQEIVQYLLIGNRTAYGSLNREYKTYDQEIFEEIEPMLTKKEKDIVTQGIRHLDVKHVISVTTTEDAPDSSHKGSMVPIVDPVALGISRTQIKAPDDTQEFWKMFAKDNYALLEELFTKIDHARNKRETLLLHCAQGISRSPTVMMAYLCSRCGLTPQQAHAFVKNKRSIVNPKKLLPGLEEWYLSKK